MAYAVTAAAVPMRQRIPLHWEHAAFPAGVPGMLGAMEAVVGEDSKVRYERYGAGSYGWFVYRITTPGLSCGAAGEPGAFFRLECGRAGLQMVLTRGAKQRGAELELRYHE